MSDRLPIYEIENEIVSRLREGDRLILSAPTGSGKSTQVPKILLNHGLLGSGQAVVLQPRRLAARMLASRVAEEMNVRLGQEVGYQIRLDNVTSRNTRIRFVTEGVLLRQMLDDAELKGISALVFDEFHERHLYGDITLARALDIQESTRPDLKIIVMSATLDSDQLAKYLAADGRKASVLSSQGRTFPVVSHYTQRASYENKSPIWEQAADAFAHFVQSGGDGDVLVFMPGAYEIDRTIDAIRYRRESKGFTVLPLHGELNPRDQDAAVARYEKRKVVVSTNVAETSLTIDGIRLVIDSGLARIPRFDPYRGINTLLVENISQASADQRAGRAGRTAAGDCYRLWSEAEHRDRPFQEKPEVQRLDLAEVVLTLKAAGVDDLRSFRWMEAPDERRLSHAEELLLDLGALQNGGHDSEVGGVSPHPQTLSLRERAGVRVSGGTNRTASITDIGRRMLAFPLHPRYARMLIAADELGCVHQACLIAALTQGRDLMIRKVDKDAKGRRGDKLGEKSNSDFFRMMNAWKFAADNKFQLDACKRMGIHALTARQVGPLLDQFLRIAGREDLDIRPHEVAEEVLQKCVLAGFSDRVARRLDGGSLRCEMVHGRTGVLARESSVHHSLLLVAAEVREIGQQGGDINTIFSQATAIEQSWLEELFPDDISTELKVSFDSQSRRVVAAEQRTFRGLALEFKKVEPPPEDRAAELLANEVMAGRLKLKLWDDSVDQWIVRLNRLADWCPDFELPKIGEDDRRALIEQICYGAFGYKDIKERHVKPVVKAWLNDMQHQLLNDHAPERLKFSNGRTPKVIYSENDPPHVSLRIQELFEVKDVPKIAMGRVTVLLHILAPNMRPVQITQDLAGFWREHYPRVKSELHRKYPKHRWPDVG